MSEQDIQDIQDLGSAFISLNGVRPDAKKEPTMGEVVSLKPAGGPVAVDPRTGRPLSMHPAAVRSRSRRAEEAATKAALVAAAAKGAKPRKNRGLDAPLAATETATGPATAAAGVPTTGQPHAGQGAATAPHTGHPEHDPVAHIAGLGLGTLVAGASVAGAYAVLMDVTDKLYHGVTGLLRAGVPLEAELIAGLGVHLVAHSRMSAWLKAPAVIACLAVSGMSVQAELTAADAVAPAAARARVVAAMAAPLRECKVEVPPVSETAGKQAKLTGEENKAKALDAQHECMKAAQKEHDEGIANAKVVSPGEGDLPRLLSWLGAVGSIAFFPLLVGFITAVRRHGRSGGAV